MTKTTLSLALLSAWAVAGTVNTDFNYQDYLDFGANKGRFQAGNSVTITSKDGSRSVYIESMPDFGGANRTGPWAGEFNNIGGSYAVSAGHMFSSARDSIGRGTALEFGGVRSRIVATSLNFQNWFDSSNRYPDTNIPKNRDFVVQRMEKLNLNQPVNLISENFFTKDSSKLQGYAYLNNLSNILNNPERYSMFVRSGTGIQGIRSNGQGIAVANAGSYFTGGLATNTYDYSTKFADGMIAIDANKKNANQFEDFAITTNIGDSGSGIYVFDNVDKQWYLLGVASVLPGCGNNSYECTISAYTLINNLAIQEFKEQHTLVFKTASNSIRNGGVYAGTSRVDETIKNADFDSRLKAMENDKDYVFTRHGSIMLREDADLGSSVLYFSDGVMSSVAGDYYLTHGGIVTGKDSSVFYGAKTKAEDALVKMGEGLLTVTSSSPTGKLRIGQGVVELKSEGLAFGSVYAINGATIIINNANQINTNYLYFGINGANLELNAQSLEFDNDIKASDFGANILNSATTKSTITLRGATDGIYHGQMNGNIDLNIQRGYVFDGSMNIKNLNVEGTVFFQAHPVVHNYVPSDSTYWANGSGLDPVKAVEVLKNESFQTTPTTENDLEAREFTFEQIALKNSTFSQSAYTKIVTNSLNADNSVITIGSGTIYLDQFDGENVRSTPCSSENTSVECRKYDAYDLEFQYNSQLTQKNIQNQEIYFFGDIDLNNNSSVTFNQAFYRGNITGDNTSSASFNNAVVKGSVSVNKLSANGSHFLLEVSNNSNKMIEATQKAEGSGNYLYVLPKEQITQKILLISLKDSQSVGSKMFMPKSYSTNFSIFKPALEYKKVNGMDNWYLSNLTVTENTQATSQANKAIGQISSGYVLEWNNLFKRMGELRDEPSTAGLWVKVFGGQSTFDSNYKTGFAELQLGADKHNVYEDFELFAGGLFGVSYYNLFDTLSGKMNGINVGAYTSFIFKNGFFVDLIAKYLHYKNDFSLTLDGQSQSLDSSNGHFAIIASAEVGYRGMVNENFYIEPQIEFISGYLGEQTLKNSEVSLITKSSVPLNFKTSVSAGYKKEDFSLRAGLGVQLDLLKSGKTELKDLYQTHTSEGYRDSRMFVNAGGTYNFTDVNRLSFEIEHSFLGKFNVDYLINVTYRHGF